MLFCMDSVSSLISRIRSADSSSALELMAYEMKKMAVMRNKDDGSLQVEIWKKLYLQLKGMGVNPLDFVKAAASPNLVLKRMGYQGLLGSQCMNYLLLMPSMLSKDLEVKQYANEALTFLCNVDDKHLVLAEIASKIEIPEEDESLHPKAIIAKAKYANKLQVSMAFSREVHLIVKLQIALDEGLIPAIEDSNAGVLKNAIFDVRSPFTKLKVLQMLHKLAGSGMELSEGLIRLLKDMVAMPFGNQIEIGLAIEAARLLMTSGNLCENVEAFMLKLISSENANFQYLGFKLISEYKAIPELAISRITELNACRKMHLDTLVRLADKSNYKTIYRKIKRLTMDGVPRDSCRKKSIEQVICRLCDFCDQEFICKILYENPKVYNYVKRRGLLVREQCRSLFYKILHHENSDYFPMIYDLFPATLKHHDSMISVMCLRHLRVLIDNRRDENDKILDYLLDFMCINGCIVSNRQMLLDVLDSLSTSGTACLIEKLISGILLFNIVLPAKLFYIRDTVFVEYAIESNFVEIKHPISIENAMVTGAVLVKKEKTDGKIMQLYEMKLECEIAIVVTVQGVKYTKRVQAMPS